MVVLEPLALLRTYQYEGVSEEDVKKMPLHGIKLIEIPRREVRVEMIPRVQGGLRYSAVPDKVFLNL